MGCCPLGRICSIYQKTCKSSVDVINQLSAGAPIINENKTVGSIKLHDDFRFEIFIDDPTVLGNINITINSEDWIIDSKVGVIFRGQDDKNSYKMNFEFSEDPKILFEIKLSIRETRKDKCGIFQREEIAKIHLEIPDLTQ